MNKSKRTYVRKKKYLNDSYQSILKTLSWVRSAGKISLSNPKLEDMALKYAKEVEAVCWAPKCKMTSNEYEDITIRKTQELCQALAQRYCGTNPAVINMDNCSRCQYNTNFTQNTNECPQAPPKIAKQTPEFFPVYKSVEEEEHIFPVPLEIPEGKESPPRIEPVVEPISSQFDSMFNFSQIERSPFDDDSAISLLDTQLDYLFL